MVRVSARARTSQEANQLGGAVILPLIFLAVGQSSGLLLVPLEVAIAIGARHLGRRRSSSSEAAPSASPETSSPPGCRSGGHGGLTDDEYLWEPAAGCWSIRARPDGTRFGEWAPIVYPDPFTTLAWRLWHLIDMYGEDRAPR